MSTRRLALASSLASILLLAQAPPRTGETIDVSIVNLDVVVTERSGARVRNLTKDDFEIHENGKPQPITNFALYDDAEEVASQRGAAPFPGVAPAGSPAPRQPRAMVLVIDHIFLWESRSKPFFAQATKNYGLATVDLRADQSAIAER